MQKAKLFLPRKKLKWKEKNVTDNLEKQMDTVIKIFTESKKTVEN